jgi:transketolase C-terminal domain/subunit
LVVVIEDGFSHNGLYSIVSRSMVEGGLTIPVLPVGMVDMFGESGNRDELYRAYRMDADSIAEDVLAAMA